MMFLAWLFCLIIGSSQAGHLLNRVLKLMNIQLTNGEKWNQQVLFFFLLRGIDVE